jgi:hypothetical protein
MNALSKSKRKRKFHKKIPPEISVLPSHSTHSKMAQAGMLFPFVRTFRDRHLFAFRFLPEQAPKFFQALAGLLFLAQALSRERQVGEFHLLLLQRDHLFFETAGHDETLDHDFSVLPKPWTVCIVLDRTEKS